MRSRRLKRVLFVCIHVLIAAYWITSALTTGGVIGNYDKTLFLLSTTMAVLVVSLSAWDALQWVIISRKRRKSTDSSVSS